MRVDARTRVKRAHTFCLACCSRRLARCTPVRVCRGRHGRGVGLPGTSATPMSPCLRQPLREIHERAAATSGSVCAVSACVQRCGRALRAVRRCRRRFEQRVRESRRRTLVDRPRTHRRDAGLPGTSVMPMRPWRLQPLRRSHERAAATGGLACAASAATTRAPRSRQPSKTTADELGSSPSTRTPCLRALFRWDEKAGFRAVALGCCKVRARSPRKEASHDER
jgi:hypothetical protein